MSLPCVYGQSKQLGKRPRRRLDLDSRFSGLGQAPALANGEQPSPAIGDLGILSGDPNSNFDPILEIGLTPPEDIQVPLPSNSSIAWALLDGDVWRQKHRCYHESNEVLQLLSIPERLFPDEEPIVLEVSQILHAAKQAVVSVHRLIDCDCAKTRGHQAMLYASLVSRILWWYREAAGDAAYRVPEATSMATSMPSPNTSSESSVREGSQEPIHFENRPQHVEHGTNADCMLWIRPRHLE